MRKKEIVRKKWQERELLYWKYEKERERERRGQVDSSNLSLKAVLWKVGIGFAVV